MSLSSSTPSSMPAHPLLDAELPFACRTLNGDSTIPLLLVSDHASNRIPRVLNQLGLQDEHLERHIAFDKGTDELTQRVAVALGLTAVMCNYSRLVIDCNRHTYDESCFPEVSDKLIIPGNQQLGQLAKEARVEALFNPYHQEIEAQLDRLQKFAAAPALIAIHSFTPRLLDEDHRPWDVGLLWDKDERLATHLIAHMKTDTSLCVGDNQPYSGKNPADYTIDTHGEGRGLPCVSIEVRNDLLLHEAGQKFWVAQVQTGIERILKDPEVFNKLAVA